MQEVFSYFTNTLKTTIKGWDFFVNWHKVEKNFSQKLENELELIGTLIANKNIENAALKLFEKNPNTIKAIPILLACRDKNICLLTEYQNAFTYQNFYFDENLSPKVAVSFLKETGILLLLQNSRIKSLSDYIYGVEVGLDTNGRKNRTGTMMENIVEFYVQKICLANNWEYLTQATQGKIKEKWNKHITVDKSSRSIDFAIHANNKLFLIESNFYEGGGSKLKSTAGEYKTDFLRWKKDGHEFIWITDGLGWKTALKPIRETFDLTDYILNLDMLEKGLLEDIINSSLTLTA